MRHVLQSIGLAALTMAGPVYAKDVQKITLAGGCFWCIEADFERVGGVQSVVSGFAGGSTANPTYKQVVGGGTGHREVVQITYDADKLPTAQLLNMFFRSVDPTDAGGQFCDRGESYSTAIYPQNSDQATAAKTAKVDAEKALGKDIVTPILSASAFYPADAYHQDYYKSSKIVLTRFGAVTKSKAYKKYRKACGRDARVKQLWGSAAAFAS